MNNVSAYVFDATKAFDGNCITERGRVKAPPYNENTFDRILLDAPCSALGQRPQLSQSLSFKQADSFPLLQKRLFKAVSSTSVILFIYKCLHLKRKKDW